MIYKKKTWINGEVIYDYDLNRMEEGIARMSNVQPNSLYIEGESIDDFTFITQLYNDYSVAFYASNEYEHRPFKYGLIVTHDSPFNAWLDGPEYEQIGLAIGGENNGKFFARTIKINGDGEYDPKSNDWKEVSYTKAELDKLFNGRMSYLGDVEALPETANNGDICRIKNDVYRSSGKCNIPIYGIESIIPYTGMGYGGTEWAAVFMEGSLQDLSNPLKAVLTYAHMGHNGFTESGAKFESYFEKNGTVYEIPYIDMHNNPGECFALDDTVANVSRYLINETNIIYYISDMTELAPELEQYLIYRTYAAGTYFIYNGREWLVLAEALPDSATVPRFVITDGSGKDYTATLKGYSQYTTGDVLVVLPHTNSTHVSPTLNINGLGTRPIKRRSISGSTTLSIAGALKYNVPLVLVYNGAEFVMQDAQPYGGRDFYTPVATAKGGTGRESWEANRLPYTDSSSKFQQLPLPTTKSFLAQEASGAPFWVAESELGGGGSSGSSGNVKKIGYTGDCDYIVVSASSALSVFRTAISEAADGDTLLVMPGTYSGSGTLSIEKNLNFIGIGKAVLTFSVLTVCEYYFDEVDYEFKTRASYTTNWSGITFSGGFSVGGEDGPGHAAQSFANCINCHFTASGAKISGTYQNCSFNINDVLTCGQYYGTGGTFYNCNIKCGAFSGGESNFYNCNIYFAETSSNYNTFGGGGYFYNCNLYLHRSGIDGSNDHGYDTNFNKCNFFGYPIVTNYTAFTQCFQYVGTEL